MMRFHGMLSFAVVVSTLIGCATSRPVERQADEASTQRFPPREALLKLATEEVSAAPPRIKRVMVDRWALAGPFPDKVATLPREAVGRWEELLAVQVKAKPGVLLGTEDMHCIARENGRFFLAHGGWPTEDLTDFIAGRCGALADDVGTSWLSGEVPEAVPDDEIFRRWRPEFEKMLAQIPAGGSRAAGVWFGRQKDQVVFIVATGHG